VRGSESSNRQLAKATLTSLSLPKREATLRPTQCIQLPCQIIAKRNWRSIASSLKSNKRCLQPSHKLRLGRRLRST
jgi:hypothetical protein